jgi:hypothetical protein
MRRRHEFWHVEVQKNGPKLQQVLEEADAKGWDLVGMIPVAVAGPVLCMFRRPLQPQPEQPTL